MTDHPILFSGPMVRAILDGRKTQTRRILKIRGHKAFSEFGPSDTKGYDWHFRDAAKLWHDLRDSELRQRLKYAPGDRLWVRETWTDLTTQPQCDLCLAGLSAVAYRATDDDEMTIPPIWRPSIFMPRWASRLTLTVTDVRVQRLQDIGEGDAIAEGVERRTVTKLDNSDPREWWLGYENGRATAKSAFRDLWDSLNAKRGFGWEANPWVCAVTFTAQQCNIDKMEGA